MKSYKGLNHEILQRIQKWNPTKDLIVKSYKGLNSKILQGTQKWNPTTA